MIFVVCYPQNGGELSWVSISIKYRRIQCCSCIGQIQFTGVRIATLFSEDSLLPKRHPPTRVHPSPSATAATTMAAPPGICARRSRSGRRQSSGESDDEQDNEGNSSDKSEKQNSTLSDDVPASSCLFTGAFSSSFSPAIPRHRPLLLLLRLFLRPDTSVVSSFSASVDSLSSSCLSHSWSL